MASIIIPKTFKKYDYDGDNDDAYTSLVIQIMEKNSAVLHFGMVNLKVNCEIWAGLTSLVSLKRMMIEKK